MVRCARIFIALMLALIVPLQALAAASAGLCMALGHHHAGAHSHHGDGNAPHHHGHDEQPSPAGSAHCPPCVACCATAAVIAYTPLFMPEARADRVETAPPSSLAGIAPAALDRPPLVS